MRALVLAMIGCAACGGDRRAPRGDDAGARAAARPADDAGPAPPAHRIVPDLATAIREVVGDGARVAAFGELHQRADRPTTRSALAWFTDEVLPVIAPRTSDLVLETWLVDPRCGERAERATAQVEATMQRPPETKSELATLVERARAGGIQPHVMRLTCDDWAAVAPPGDGGGPAELQYEVLLATITRELGRIGASAIRHRDREGDPRRLVAIYGGAIHNDLHPIEGIDDWTFAPELDRAAGGALVEVDLLVPELAAADALTQAQPWAPLVGRAGPEHVVVIERGPRSFVIVLPTAP